jgi:PAS domain S-box-containing protein
VPEAPLETQRHSVEAAPATPAAAPVLRSARVRALRRYGSAVALALAALLLTRVFREPLAGAHFVFSMGAVFLAALFAGTGPGLLAVLVCAAGYPLAAGEAASLAGSTGAAAARLGLFLLVGAAQAVGAGELRHAHAQARRDRARLARRAERQRRARLRAGGQLEMLRAITGDLAEGLCGLDVNGRLVFMNGAAARMLGWSEEELAGRRFHELVHAARADGTPQAADECPLLAVLRDGGVVRGEDQVFRRKDGATFPVSYSCSPIRRGGRIVGAALAFQDWSARVRAERAERFLAQASQALTESIDWEATLARVAELAVPFLGDWCLVVVAGEGNPRSVAAASSDPARVVATREMLDRYPIDLSAAHGVGRVLRTGEAEIVPEVSVEDFAPEESPDGRRRRELLRRLGLRSFMAAPLVARGRTLGAIGFSTGEGGHRYGPEDLALARELAARCALAIDNARLYREAQEATRSREEVLAVVSHDLRAPLGTLQLAAQVVARLASAEACPDLHRAADTAQRSAERLARLVDDLVTFARAERGRLALDRGAHDPAVIAREAAALAEPLAREGGLALVVEAGEGLPPAWCDRHRILQVLANLLGNALKVTPRGGEIRVAVSRAGREVRFAVADTGPGIAPADQPHVFERYWRAKDASYEGSGLGLAIARAVVEAHGGRIALESAPGAGTTFTFGVPLKPPLAGP